MKRLIPFLLALLPLVAHADLNLDAPKVLLERAARGKDQLREVINDLDQNIGELRDPATFDRYFFLMDDLQKLAVKMNLDTIYPDAVPRLADRYVKKGVNWLDFINDRPDKLLYYHRWMRDSQPAFNFLYATGQKIKDGPTAENLRRGAQNLETVMKFADGKWPNETALRVLYRDTLSDVAIKILRTPNLSETETLFWLGKVYTTQSVGEVVDNLQGKIYAVEAPTKKNLHVLLRRLITVHEHVTSRSFTPSENLLNQIGDLGVDLFLRSLRYQEKLSDNEFEALLKMFQRRHLISLAGAWTALQTTMTDDDFAYYAMQRANRFVELLSDADLLVEAKQLSLVIMQKSSSVMGRREKVEGLYRLHDARGREGRLNVIFANRDTLFVEFVDQKNTTYSFYRVAYDSREGGFIAAFRDIDHDSTGNIPFRFFPGENGQMRVVGIDVYGQIYEMEGNKIQNYPDNFADEIKNSKTDLNGVYQGMLTLVDGNPTPVELVVTVLTTSVIANLTHPSFFGSMNFGNEVQGNVIYLTRGSSYAMGNWLHIRGVYRNGYLDGTVIVGSTGIAAQPIHWKKVRTLK